MAIVTFNNDNVGSSCNLTVTLDSGQTVNVGTVNFPYYFNPTDHNLGPNDVEGNYSFDCGSCVYEFIVTGGDVTTTTTPKPTTTTTTTEEEITTTTTPTPTTTTTTTEEDITTTTTPTPTTTTTTTLPLLECKDITITIPGGLEGSGIRLNTINATKGNENFTVTGVNPNTIQAGPYNYSVTIQVPSTYSNEGSLTCSDIEVIGLTTTTTVKEKGPCDDHQHIVYISRRETDMRGFCGDTTPVRTAVRAKSKSVITTGQLCYVSSGDIVADGYYLISLNQTSYDSSNNIDAIQIVNGYVDDYLLTDCSGGGQGSGEPDVNK